MKMLFLVAEKNTDQGLLLVVTDPEIVGKIFAEGKKQLDLSKNFYQGKEKNAEEVKRKFMEAHIIHLTGEHAVALGLELKVVNPNKILWVKKIPHAEVLMGL